MTYTAEPPTTVTEEPTPHYAAPSQAMPWDDRKGHLTGSAFWYPGPRQETFTYRLKFVVWVLDAPGYEPITTLILFIMFGLGCLVALAGGRLANYIYQPTVEPAIETVQPYPTQSLKDFSWGND